MFIAGGSRKLLGVGGGPEGRGGEGGLAAAAREFGGGIGRLVVEGSLALLLVQVQAMQTTMLILEFGEAQSILQTKGNLEGEGPGSVHITNRKRRNIRKQVKRA